MPEEQKVVQKQSVMRSALAMSMGTLASRILGFVRDALMLALYSRTVTDAWVVAFKLPNFFRRILGEGSLSVSYIPVFVSLLKVRSGESPEQAKERAMELTHVLYTLLTAITMTLTVVSIYFMDEIMEFWVGNRLGYAAVPGKMQQTIFLSRVMFAYLYLVTTYAYLMAVANALKKFLIPALAPAAFNFVFILVSLLPQSWSQVPGDLLAWAVIVGGVVQQMMVFILLWRMGYRPKIHLNLRAEGLREVVTNMIPGILGLGIFQLLTVLNVKFAARLSEGAQSYIYAGDRLLELPQSLIAISLGSALLPSFSSLLADGKKQAMLQTANKYLRILCFLAIPSSLGLYLLSLPICQVLFQRGQFSAADTLATAEVTKIYCFLLLFSSIAKVISPAFYAIKNTLVPAVIAIFCVIIHCVVANFFVDWYGVNGIVASTSISGFLNMFLLIIAYQKYIGAIDFKAALVSILKILPALIAMGAFAHFGYAGILQGLSAVELPEKWLQAFSLFTVLFASIPVYFFVALKTRSAEAADILEIFSRRFKSSP